METEYSDDLIRIDGNISQWIAGRTTAAGEGDLCSLNLSIEDLGGSSRQPERGADHHQR
jgi:hypothetical protein